MMRGVAAIAMLGLIGCASTPEKQAAADNGAEKKTEAPAPVKDDTALLLTANRTAAEVVPDHVLGNSALPGGTVGDYAAGGKKYKLFIIETPSAQDAAILLLDVKSTLKDPAYIAYMGGYSGADASGPFYVFSKGKYLAGVTGLPEKSADPIARQLAAQLH